MIGLLKLLEKSVRLAQLLALSRHMRPMRFLDASRHVCHDFLGSLPQLCDKPTVSVAAPRIGMTCHGLQHGRQ